jgi:ATPase subunit of ABC transporter with duplicated ATPase domains
MVFKLISVCGTPTCGKTTLMQLLSNRLFTRHGTSPQHTIPTLVGWVKQVEAVGGWNGYLEKTTSVNGNNWLGHASYLLVEGEFGMDGETTQKKCHLQGAVCTLTLATVYEYHYECRRCLKLLHSNGFAHQDIRSELSGDADYGEMGCFEAEFGGEVVGRC